MKALRKISFILISFSVFLVSCTRPATRPMSTGNLADIYNPGRSTLHPDFFVHHINDTSSVLYLRVFTSELLFNQANEEGKLQAKLKIFYELREIDPFVKDGVFIDSISIMRTLNKDGLRNSFFSGLPVRARIGKKYSIKIEMSDEMRSSTTLNILIVDKTSIYGSQNFKVLSANSSYPSFTNYFAPGELFRLQFNQLGIDSLFVDYFSLDRALPRPAFSSLPEVPMKTFPDTSFIYPWSDSIQYELPVAGIYHFRMNPDFKEGLTLFNFGESFPKVQTADDLLGPLVYLTSSAEFRDIRMEQNRKLAIDNFWLKLNPDASSAKELIRVFYNRVYFANLYFSSYKEGWKTDRGMIYIIFGPPRRLEKTPDTEKWSYFSKRGGTTAVFEFKRKENQFTNLDFQLERNVSSSSFWREAIEAWRKGRVYAIDF